MFVLFGFIACKDRLNKIETSSAKGVIEATSIRDLRIPEGSNRDAFGNGLLKILNSINDYNDDSYENSLKAISNPTKLKELSPKVSLDIYIYVKSRLEEEIRYRDAKKKWHTRMGAFDPCKSCSK